MVKSRKIVTIFVASPSDVGAERHALERVADELNLSLGPQLQAQLGLLKWETHSRPAAGPDPQAIIENQIGDDFDIFLAIFWSRIGTPTPRAKSGTLEEFERAYQRRKDRPGSVEIMIYFKDEPLPPTQIDPDQLKELHQFKSGLGELGILYHEFRSTEEFEKLARVHLTSVMATFAQQEARTVGEVAVIAKAAHAMSDATVDGEVDLSDPDLGFLDFDEIFEDSVRIVTSTQEEIGAATKELGEQLNSRAAEIRNAKSNLERKRITNQAARDMDHYTAVIERVTPTFRDAQQRMAIAAGRALALRAAADSLDLSEASNFLAVSQGVIDQYRQTRAQVGGFADTVSRTPPVSAAVVKSTRRLTRALAVFLEEYALGERLIDSIRATVQEKLAQQDTKPLPPS